MPHTSQGKIDKRNLISAFKNLDYHYLINAAAGIAEDIDSSEELSETELQLRTEVASVVNIPASGIRKHSSFFGIGLDSISAISFSRRLRDTGFPGVTVSTILKNSSIARLASAISAGTSSVQDQISLPKIFSEQELKHIKLRLASEGTTIAKILPCTPLQEAMLSASQDRGSDAYCNVVLFKIVGDLKWLKQAWNVVIQRHEIFRTSFFPTSDPSYPFAQVVLSGIAKLWAEESDDSFRGNSGATISCLLESHCPPFHARTVQLDGEIHLEFSYHHALYDGSAIQNLISEVEAQYRHEVLPPPTTADQFMQHVVRLQSEHATEFWTKTLKGFKPIISKPTSSSSYSTWKSHLEVPLYEVESVCHNLSVSLLTVVQSALAKTLAQVFEIEDVCFGNVVSGRTLSIEGLDNLIFPTFNTIPIRADLSQTKTNHTLFQYIQQFNASSEEFQLASLRSIQNRLGFGAGGLFSSLLLLQHGEYELDFNIWELKADTGNMNVSNLLSTCKNRLTVF
jgi:aryl carrier-like protein